MTTCESASVGLESSKASGVVVGRPFLSASSAIIQVGLPVGTSVIAIVVTSSVGRGRGVGETVVPLMGKPGFLWWLLTTIGRL